MNRCKQERNFMDEMHDIICKIESLKPEPEVCNASCPPLGCPLGPCPGVCCSKGICDPCCVSKMPRGQSSLLPPRCCMPKCLKDYTCSTVRLSSCDSSSIYINRGNRTTQNDCSNSIPNEQPGFQASHFPPYNLISTVLPHCAIGSELYWNA